MATTEELISKVNPKLYPKGRALLLKGDINEGFLLDQDEELSMDDDATFEISDEKTLLYECYAESLEPIYYWLYDFMQNFFGKEIIKVVDNFQSAPGSAHFSEMGQRKSIMQQQASKIMGDINTVLRSVLNLVYDLKEFKIRLGSYKDLKDPKLKESALLSLKQVWMDKVDVNKGNSSIKAMALGQGGFVTLLDAFLVANSQADAERLDLDDRVKRIVKQRLAEFEIWVKESELELTKRYEIEKNYLKSQAASLKMYSSWAKPYLQYARDLEQKEGASSNAALVNAFNRTLLQVTLFGIGREVDSADLAEAGLGPYYKDKDWVKDMKSKNKLRNYFPCLLMDFQFRAVPQQGNYIGRVTVSFKTYSLNESEINEIKNLLKQEDLKTGLSFIQGATDESIDKLTKEIEDILNEKDSSAKVEPKKEEKKSEGLNPFTALFGGYNEGSTSSSSKEAKKDEKKEYEFKDDATYEKNLRKLAAAKAISGCFTIYDVYKKSHGMPSYA